MLCQKRGGCGLISYIIRNISAKVVIVIAPYTSDVLEIAAILFYAHKLELIRKEKPLTYPC